MAVLRAVFGFYVRLVGILIMPLLLSGFFARSTGREYGIGLFAKVRLILRIRRNVRRVICASHWLEHVAMATAILRIPRAFEGCVVECGCYKGGSTTNLSLVSALCGRELVVFDSFAGLPEPDPQDRVHLLVDQAEAHTYFRGAFTGTIDEVRSNVTRYGDVRVCKFEAGYFEDTLPHFTRPCVFAFLDVDLLQSVEVCLKSIWPLLHDGCPLFTHEASHLKIAEAFFDRAWWREHLGCDPPGLVGAGRGLGLIFSNGGFRSGLGYTMKNVDVNEFVPSTFSSLLAGNRLPARCSLKGRNGQLQSSFTVPLCRPG
jgi:hypothetical protein